MRVLPRLDARIPPWRTDALVGRACPFCGHAGREAFLRPDQLTVRACEQCGCHFVSPTPSEADLAQFYASYHIHHARRAALDAEYARSVLSEDPLSDVRVQRINALLPLAGKRILDVGFGGGELLAKCSRLGASVAGVDLDPDVVRFACEQLRLADVHCGTLAAVAAERFDAIFMNDFIEHPLDPLDVLRQACGLLRPGGLISIWTPNGSHLREEADPVALRVDLEHMQYLSYGTVVFAGRALGLEVVHLESLGFPGLQNIGNIPAPKSAVPGAHVRLVRALKRGARRVSWVRRALELRDRASRARQRDGKYHLMAILRDARQPA